MLTIILVTLGTVLLAEAIVFLTWRGWPYFTGAIQLADLATAVNIFHLMLAILGVALAGTSLYVSLDRDGDGGENPVALIATATLLPQTSPQDLVPSTTPTTDLQPTTDPGIIEAGRIAGSWHLHYRSFSEDAFIPPATTSIDFLLEERRDDIENYGWKMFIPAINLTGRAQVGAGIAMLQGSTLRVEGATTSGSFEADLELGEDSDLMTGTVDGRVVTLNRRN